jgi:hypothetical protein
MADLFHPSSLIASAIDAAVESMLTGIESHHGLQWRAGLRQRPEKPCIVVGPIHAVLKIPRLSRGSSPSSLNPWDGLPPIPKGAMMSIQALQQTTGADLLCAASSRARPRGR